MRLSKPVEIHGVSQALAKGNCPVCAFLRNSQSTLLQGGLHPEEVNGICNFHAWALAAAVNVTNAAKIFQNLLRPACDGSQECSFCVRLREAEQPSLGNSWGRWIGSSCSTGLHTTVALCRPHARRMRQVAPVRLDGSIDEVESRILSDLNLELENLVTRSAMGEKAGAGVLGRMAEFLMSQRGIRG